MLSANTDCKESTISMPEAKHVQQRYQVGIPKHTGLLKQLSMFNSSKLQSTIQYSHNKVYDLYALHTEKHKS